MHDVTSGVQLTYDDLLRLPDDRLRHELIEGTHYVTASPNTRHQHVLGEIYFALRSHLERHPGGSLFLAPVDVVLSARDVVVPDMVYLSAERAADVLTHQVIRGMPDLIVEILSPGTRRRDRTVKQALYDREGVTEYWLVDPQRDRIRVFRRADEGLVLAADLSTEANDTLTTPLLPGLSVPLSRVFR